MNQPGPPETLLERIGAMRESGAASARRVAEVITRDPKSAASRGIVELAKASETSVGSINRFCRSVGISGYTALRLAVATEVGHDSRAEEDADPSGDIDPATPVRETVQLIAASSRKAITRTAELLDYALLDRLARAVHRARLVQVVAFGGSSHVALYLADQLTGIGVPALTTSDANTAASIVATLSPSDVVVALSHSGMARHAVDVVRAARDQGALTAAITSSQASSLAEAAELSLVTTARTSTSRYRGTAGRHAQLFVTDALYVRVAQRRHDRANALLDRAGALTAPYQLRPRSARGDKRDHPGRADS